MIGNVSLRVPGTKQESSEWKAGCEKSIMIGGVKASWISGRFDLLPHADFMRTCL